MLSDSDIIEVFKDMSRQDIDELINNLEKLGLFKLKKRKLECEKALLRRFEKDLSRVEEKLGLVAVKKSIDGQEDDNDDGSDPFPSIQVGV